jgi:hypothetical protein
MAMKIGRLSFGLLLIAAIVAQLFTFRQTPINFFSYFTVLSNLLAGLTLIAVALNNSKQNSFDSFRGASTIYVLIAGLGFIILLGGKNDEFIEWVNLVLHYLAPMVLLADWIFTPSEKIGFKSTLAWIVFPVFYFGYTLARGSITGWYPYEFLNPTTVGSTGVLTYAGVILGSFFVLSWLSIKAKQLASKVL